MTGVGRIAAALLLIGGSAQAHDLALQGQITTPQVFTEAALRALPPTHVDVTFAVEHGAVAKHAVYDGVLLWSLIDAARLIDAPGRKTHPLHVFLAHGADGYAVALSIGEIDPHYEAKQVIVAYAQDGKNLPALELVVPGDRRAARYVKDLVSVEVK